MNLIQQLAAVAYVVAAHFAFDAAGIEFTSTADTTALSDLREQGVAPRWQALRGKWLPLAAHDRPSHTTRSTSSRGASRYIASAIT